MLYFKNYTSYYSNRVNRRGGGAAIFILTSIISEPMTNLTVNLPHIDAVFVKVTLPNITVNVSSIYRTPSSNFNVFKTYIDNNPLSLSRNESVHIICGNFISDILKRNESSNNASTFYNDMKIMALIPNICKLTCLTNSSCTLIDNIFASNLRNFVSGRFNIVIIDHLPIFIIYIYLDYLTTDSLSPKEITYRLINEATLKNFYERFRSEVATFSLDHGNVDFSI